MITSETPYKLSEIIRDTWPGLYKNQKKMYSQYTINIVQNSGKKI